jgi:hypothetical protein
MDVALAAPHAPGFSVEVDVASAKAIGDSLRTASPEKGAIPLVLHDENASSRCQA